VDRILDASIGPESSRETYAELRFHGKPNVLSVDWYDFWENAPMDYEFAKASQNNVRIIRDSAGMPIFKDLSGEHESWYSAGNGTDSPPRRAVAG
jgi:hypothetical protein